MVTIRGRSKNQFILTLSMRRGYIFLLQWKAWSQISMMVRVTAHNLLMKRKNRSSLMMGVKKGVQYITKSWVQSQIRGQILVG